ncbi:MAG: MBL fold metallo-hydrolase [Anaerostipes sp.]|nr:MBL fold metallo-hydrolase [Anaerostipes sp.]
MSHTKLIILGTGNAMVTKCFNTCFAIENEDKYMLVDAGGGNGILVQMEKAKIPFEKLHEMFVTHGHTDHIIGVVWVIRKIATMMRQEKYEGEFTIYCHDLSAEIIKSIAQMTLTKKFSSLIGERIHVVEVKDGEQIVLAGMKMKVFDILSTKDKQFGFTLDLPNGQKFTCLGDEPYKEHCESYAKNADWLLCEAFCLYEHRDIFKPYEKHHSTALDTGKLAEELKVKNLLMYHTEDKNLDIRKEAYTKEARENFTGNIYVPDDLEEICIY